MLSNTRRALPYAVFLVLLAACSGEAPQAPASPATAGAADAAAPTAPAAASITDEAGLRAAAAKALSEQRFYAPARNSALDHYLALRELRPDDADLTTAMLELLPYAVIGIEQAVARQELAEAQRLLGLLERADPQAPSLVRLRDSIAAAEAGAEAAAAEVLAKAERDETAKLAAEQAQAATPAPAATRPPAPVASAPAASLPPAAARPAPPPRVAASTTAAAPPPAAAPAAAPVSAAGVPRLLSAPSPRYPIMAQRRKLEGQVVVQFTIQADGSVAAPRVVSADPPGIFDEAALVAASRWRFEAGSRSVPSSRVVQFRLGEGQR